MALSFRFGTSTNYVMIDRYMEWGNTNGTSNKLVDIDDNYLINVYHFVQKRIKYGTCVDFDERLLCVIEELFTERGRDIKKYPTFIPYETAEGVWILDDRVATEEEILAHKLGLPMKKAIEDVDASIDKAFNLDLENMSEENVHALCEALF